jgi:hypothetical protein
MNKGVLRHAEFRYNLAVKVAFAFSQSCTKELESNKSTYNIFKYK